MSSVDNKTRPERSLGLQCEIREKQFVFIIVETVAEMIP